MFDDGRDYEVPGKMNLAYYSRKKYYDKNSKEITKKKFKKILKKAVGKTRMTKFKFYANNEANRNKRL